MFESAQRFFDDESFLAADAADVVPRLRWGDALADFKAKPITTEDNKTLHWTCTVLEVSWYGLCPQQVQV